MLGVEIGSAYLDPGSIHRLTTLLSFSPQPGQCVLLFKSASRVDSCLFHNPDSTIVEACLIYLNLKYVRAFLPTPPSGQKCLMASGAESHLSRL